MLIGYFKRERFVGFRNGNLGGIPHDYDESIGITSEQLQELMKGAKGKIVEGELHLYQDSQDLSMRLEKKKQQATNCINSRYKIHDQLNIISKLVSSFMNTLNEDTKTSLGSDLTIFEDMKLFIDGVLNEYQTNQEESNYENFYNPTQT